jgi:hypothetical protein
MARARSARRGLTLVELVLALGIAALLVLGLLQLLDGALSLWGRADQRRSSSEASAAVNEQLAQDVGELELGVRGDFLLDWTRCDFDGDGLARLPLPRLRLIRPATPAELARLAPEAEPAHEALLEIAWALLPGSAGARGEAREFVLWRGERVQGAPGASYFDPAFFGSEGRPPVGALHELSGGVLWFELACASAASELELGWRVGDAPGEARASWDARGAGRPDPEACEFNESGARMRSGLGRLQLPRRVRALLELESDADRRRHTRLAAPLGATDAQLQVIDGERLPPAGSTVLVDEEWLELLSVEGASATVRRALRGTRAAVHEAGALVRSGRRSVREIPLGPLRWEMAGDADS